MTLLTMRQRRLCVDLPYVPVSRPCPGVPAGWWKCPDFLSVCEDHSKIRKNTVAGVKTFFFFENTLKITQNYDCPGSLSEKYGNPTSVV